MKKKIINTIWVMGVLALAGFCLSACNHELDIQQAYPFTVETMPVQKHIVKGQTAEIRCTLKREGNFADTRYTIRYFQTDGKGRLKMDDGTVFKPNDRYPLTKEVFRLYYTSASSDQQTIDVYVEDNFGQTEKLSFELTVKRKRKFSTNDLLVIDYYFFHLYGRKQYDKKLFERIVKRVLNQEIWTDDVYNIVLFNDLMAIAALKIFHNSFSDFLTVVDKALAVIEKSQFYSYKPSVFVLKAKYELLHKGNKKKATENYDKAIMFASVLEDSVLEESIKAGKAADGL